MDDTPSCDRCEALYGRERMAAGLCRGCLGFYCDECERLHKHRGELETEYVVERFHHAPATDDGASP